MSTSVCVCVCLSVCENISGTTRAIFTNFCACRLWMTVARSSSGVVAIRTYVLPVLSMTWLARPASRCRRAYILQLWFFFPSFFFDAYNLRCHSHWMDLKQTWTNYVTYNCYKCKKNCSLCTLLTATDRKPRDIAILACPPPPEPSIPARSRSALAACHQSIHA